MTETQSKSIMAFDCGTQKMGMAIGQSSIESANPLPRFVMKEGIPNWDQLLKVVKEWQPDLVLVG
ncbi:Holliday junction resolvase RuvX, partial [Acinetobacter pittii]|uniref:Holliday junction resolvase RuvX n=1 Tax=Acinetobacter pittii TaxID=48296 RepID=UPI003AF785D7